MSEYNKQEYIIIVEDNNSKEENKNIKHKEEYIIINRCISCGIDLGESNPRQYCCKTYCPLEEK
jgi:hypothetical protein